MKLLEKLDQMEEECRQCMPDNAWFVAREVAELLSQLRLRLNYLETITGDSEQKKTP